MDLRVLKVFAAWHLAVCVANEAGSNGDGKTGRIEDRGGHFGISLRYARLSVRFDIAISVRLLTRCGRPDKPMVSL